MVKKSRKSTTSEVSAESSDKKSKKDINKNSDISNVVKIISRDLLNRSENKNNGKWVDLVEDRPSPRSHCSITQIDGGNVIFFGGEFFDGLNVNLYNDTYLYNLGTHNWKFLDTPSMPIPRCSHQSCLYNNRIYIFGGEFNNIEEFYHFNDLWYLDLNNLRWYKLNCLGNSPTPRSGHRMVLWKHYWFLFGGFHDNGKESFYYNDLYYFDMKTEKWYHVDQKLFAAYLPEPRSGCVLLPINDDKHLLMHGGFNKKETGTNINANRFEDSWIVDINSVLLNNSNVLVWSKIHTNNKHEFTTGVSYAFTQDYAILFGGVNDVDQGLSVKSTFTNKCFKLNLNQRKFNPVELQFEGFNGEEYIEDFQNFTLSKSIPTPRMNSCLTIYENKLFLFGGLVEIKNVEINLSDVWCLDLIRNEWKCIDSGFKNDVLYKKQIETEESSSELDEDMESDDDSMDGVDYSDSDGSIEGSNHLDSE